MKYLFLILGLIWIMPVCAKEYSFEREPFVHPFSVRLLVEGIPDDVPTIQVDLDVMSSIYEWVPVIVNSGEVEAKERRENKSFSYELLGKVGSDIFVLLTKSWNGGTMIETNVLFVKMGQKPFLEIDEEDNTIRFGKPAQTIERVGQIILGDRWIGEIKLEGDLLTIGADGNRYGNRTDMPPKTYKIKVQ